MNNPGQISTTRERRIAYVGSALSAVLVGVIARAVFGAPSWAMYLAIVIVFYIHRIGDRLRESA